MKYLKNILELKSSTWDSAIKKAKEHGQDNLAKKFSEWKGRSGWLERKRNDLRLQIRDSYEFDYYFDTMLFSESDTMKVGKVGKVKVNDFIGYEFIDNGFSCMWYMEGDSDAKLANIEPNEDNMLLSRMDIYRGNNGEVVIEDSLSDKNKFANRKSANKFIEMLKKMYLLESPDFNGGFVGKLNDTEIDGESGQWHKFVNIGFGSWEGFIEKLNIRSIYDSH